MFYRLVQAIRFCREERTPAGCERHNRSGVGGRIVLFCADVDDDATGYFD